MAKNVVVNVVGDTSKLDKALAKSETGLKGFGAVAKKALIGLAAIGVTAGVVGKKLLDHGVKMELMGKKAQTVFGDQIDIVTKWSKEVSAKMGLTSREVTGLAANFGDLLIPMGFTRAEAVKMSTEVVGLSGALAKWSNGTRTAAEVANILSKAMLGEREGLKELGISINQAEVDARVMENTSKGLTFATEQQAKAVATQQLIFEKSKDAQDAYRKSGGDLADQMNQLKAIFGEVKDALSLGLVKVINDFMASERGEGIKAWFRDAATVLREGLGPAAKSTDKDVRSLAEGIQEVVQALKDLWTIGKAIFNFFKGLVDVFLDIARAIDAIPGIDLGAVTRSLESSRAKASAAAAFTGAGVAPGRRGAGGGPIRAFAHGGIVTSPTLALIGEAGPEAVVPLGRGGRGGAGGGAPVVNVTVLLDSREIQNALVRVGRRNGGSALGAFA